MGMCQMSDSNRPTDAHIIITNPNGKYLPLIYFPFIKSKLFGNFSPQCCHTDTYTQLYIDPRAPRDRQIMAMPHQPEESDRERRKLENTKMKNARLNKISII